MDKNNSREGKRSKSVAQKARRRQYIHMAVLVLIFGALAAGVFFFLNGRQTAARSTGPPTGQEPVAAPEAKPGFDRLQGRWQRPDGGYVIDIKDIANGGKMAAAYFNPRPINVSQAEAALDGTTLKVFIELRDVNYPGATYHLTYDPGSDQLKGVYFQPALQQSFEVFFVRMK
jgi:hypothetical protein